MKHEKSCGAICYTREEGAPRVLVICHRYGGHWAFPKGHVEAGESEEETAMREVREETGAQVRVRPGYREVTTYSPAKGVTKDVVFFVAEITGGTYFHAADADGMKQVMDEINQLEKTTIEQPKYIEFREYGPTLALLALALLMLGFIAECTWNLRLP